MPTTMGPPAAGDNVLAQIRDVWLKARDAAVAEKEETYVPGALECLMFYKGDHGYVLKLKEIESKYLIVNQDADGKVPRQPAFVMSDNVAAKYVAIHTPYLMGQGDNHRIINSHELFLPPPEFYGVVQITPQMVQQAQQQGGQAVAQLQQMYQLQMWYQQQVQAYQHEDMLRNFRATMLERLLNYTVKELGFRNEQRYVVQESLVLGMGIGWTEILELPQNGGRLPFTHWEAADDLLFDPDAKRLTECKWIMRRCYHPTWQVARKYGIPEEDLNPSASSTVALARANSLTVKTGANNAKQQNAADLFEYWEIYSRLGIGTRLIGLKERQQELSDFDGVFGDYSYIVVADGCDYPLNLGPQVADQAKQMAMQQIAAQKQAPLYHMMGVPAPQPPDPMDVFRQATAWPTPYYHDLDNPWPITMLSFHERTGSPYPIPPLEFSLSYMKFMVWVISFIADKCVRSNRDIWVLPDDVSQQLEEAIQKERDEAIVKVKTSDLDKVQGDVKKLIHLFQAPEIHESIFNCYEFMKQRFEEMSGMNDLMQAQMSRSLRSATEAKIVSDASQLRPQDMKGRFLEWEVEVARKEAIAARCNLGGQDLQFLLGPLGAQAWDQGVRAQRPEDVVQILREAIFDVEAGPGAKLDPEGLREQSGELAQFVIPAMMQMWQQTGISGPLNNVMAVWAKGMQMDPKLVEFPDLSQYMQWQQQMQMAQEQQRIDQDGEAKKAQAKKKSA